MGLESCGTQGEWSRYTADFVVFWMLDRKARYERPVVGLFSRCGSCSIENLILTQPKTPLCLLCLPCPPCHFHRCHFRPDMACPARPVQPISDLGNSVRDSSSYLNLDVKTNAPHCASQEHFIRSPTAARLQEEAIAIVPRSFPA